MKEKTIKLVIFAFPRFLVSGAEKTLLLRTSHFTEVQERRFSADFNGQMYTSFHTVASLLVFIVCFDVFVICFLCCFSFGFFIFGNQMRLLK